MMHFNELRWRLIVFLLVVAIAVVCFYGISDRLIHWLLLPIQQEWAGNKPSIVTQNVTELFTNYVYVSIWSGFLVCLPILLFQFERFLSPGLYQAEKNWLRFTLMGSGGLFYSGMLFAWLVLMPMMLSFFLGFQQTDVLTQVTLSGYLEFLFKLMLLVGLAFNAPVLLILLMKFKVIQLKQLVKMRRFVVVGIFVLAAIFTPPDPISQTVLALPLWFLFEATLFLARMLKI